MQADIQATLLPRLSSRYGAPMGRHSVRSYETKRGEVIQLDVTEKAAPFHLVRIPLDSQGYDAGGAYWGHSKGERLYGYIGPITDIRGYVRAADRDAAKAAVRETFPLARFFR
jgi:hypothetical protein